MEAADIFLNPDVMAGRPLPRKEQEFVIRFLDTVLEKAGRA